MHQEFRTGLEYLETITTLLQRARAAHPTRGLFEAAELQWWWARPRPTDDLPQLFWFDDDGQPEAAVIVTTHGTNASAVYGDTTVDPLFMPHVGVEQIAQVIERGLDHATASGIETIELEVDQSDDMMRSLLNGHGFESQGEALVETWLASENQPEVSPLAEGYQLRTRTETASAIHHMVRRNGPDVEQRLLQTSLYRPDLDLVILDDTGTPAAYGMFWHDPVTNTGVVEPVRTEEDHQQRGLARHLLTAGVDRLVRAGAERISIGYEPDNPASGHLYRSVGFEPHRTTELYSRSTSRA